MIDLLQTLMKSMKRPTQQHMNNLTYNKSNSAAKDASYLYGTNDPT